MASPASPPSRPRPQRSANAQMLHVFHSLVCVSSSLFPLSCHCFLQRSSSSESLSEKGPSELKSFDAVVFDVLKVTPEEYAVSQTSLCVREAFVFVHSSLFTLSDYAGILNRGKTGIPLFIFLQLADHMAVSKRYKKMKDNFSPKFVMRIIY